MPKSTPIFLCQEFILLCSCLLCCLARDTIMVDDLLTDGDTIISAGRKFELGFFTPLESPGDTRRYVGIWYYNLSIQTVVWVANRGTPLLDRTGVFSVQGNGNLEVLDGTGKSYWSTALDHGTMNHGNPNRAVKLMDSGNLVLSDDNQWTTILWQSFEHPTNTFLPGMKMDKNNINLTSWSSLVDPKEGNFTFQVDQDDSSKFIILINVIRPYWKSGKRGDFDSSLEIPHSVSNLLSNYSYGKLLPWEPSPRTSSSYSAARIVMDTTGQIQYWNLDKVKKYWSLVWWEPRDKCSVFKACGKFGSCNRNNGFSCKCLPGFKPSYQEEWKHGNFGGGCIRKSTPCGGATDRFLSLKMMKLSNPDSTIVKKDEEECRNVCLNDCQCNAYFFDGENTQTREGFKDNCFIWTEDIYNLREENLNTGHNLFVRVAASDIALTGKDCQPCGTNMLPYPLSTGLNCGDPMYSSFYCDNSTEKVRFKALSGTYDVSSVDADTRTFTVQDRQRGNCKARNSRGEIVQLNQSLPFEIVEYFCHDTSDIASESTAEVEIRWDPPLQPTCNSPADCNDWPHSTCNFTEDGTRRCICNSNFRWNPLDLNCTQEEIDKGNKQFGGSLERKRPVSLIVGIIVSSTIVLAFVIVFAYIWTKKTTRKEESRKNMERDEAMLYGTEKRVKDMINAEEFTREGIDVPFFTLETIIAATDNFSGANKLGRGGFGAVYKGKFPGGHEIAIKRLSSISMQGLEEFKNEVVLIARLQHRNLVRLLGYCIKGDEKMLLYEYMPNKSLDTFIFDEKLSMMLNWEMRFNIILGIARGLVYLHHDSRLRIIHRDLKTSNILLDHEMNPKISDFGLARMFEGKQTEGTTNRVIGTYGYMSPEYALDGLFSVKSDVFSFGIVVLEVLSGKRNTGYFKSHQSSVLLGYAWRLWKENKALELMDETIRESYKENEFLNCVIVALLCVQEEPADRPTMSNVVVMLSSENATFPTPKQPAFVEREGKDPSTTASSSSMNEISVDFVTNFGGHSTTSSL